jgi:hypothetical protein
MKRFDIIRIILLGPLAVYIVDVTLIEWWANQIIPDDNCLAATLL